MNGSPDGPALLACAAVALGAWGMARPREGRAHARLLLGAGAMATATFVLRPSAWLAATASIGLMIAAIAMLPAWRGQARDPRGLAGDAARALGVAFSLPLVFAAVAAGAGTLPTLVREIDLALPVHPVAAVARAALGIFVATLAFDGLRHGRSAAQASTRVCAGAVVAALALRAAWIASVTTLPSEAFWPEAPLLVNALKLDAGQPLYGPPEELASYTYSPLLDLFHHALLAPLHAELSVYAHRAIVLVEQVAAVALLVVTLRPRLRVDALLIVALAALANLLAPSLHPDHALLACFAVAVALVVAEDRWPRAIWWTALVLVTPIATAFKLSGAGIGLGLAAAFALEQRWRQLGALAGSAAITVATVPLFAATLGRFRFYAIDVQASHPIVWARLAELPTTPAGLTAVAAIAMHLWLRLGAGVHASSETRRVAALTASVTLASLPAYLKYGGRDNNVSLLLLGAVIVLLLRARDATTRAPHPTLAPAAALLAVLLFRPLSAPPSRAERAAAVADFDRATAAVRDADARGARVLVLVHSTAWIAAGHRDVPHDRYHSAVELFFGHYPQANLLFSHVDDGRYDTLVATGSSLRDGPDLLGQFSGRLRAAIERHYEIVDPPGRTSLDGIDGVIVFRRRRDD